MLFKLLKEAVAKDTWQSKENHLPCRIIWELKFLIQRYREVMGVSWCAIFKQFIAYCFRERQKWRMCDVLGGKDKCLSRLTHPPGSTPHSPPSTLHPLHTLSHSLIIHINIIHIIAIIFIHIIDWLILPFHSSLIPHIVTQPNMMQCTGLCWNTTHHDF